MRIFESFLSGMKQSQNIGGSLYSGLGGVEKIPVEDIIVWLGDKYDIELLENYFANRILYPQTISITETDINFDYAVLKAYLRLNAAVFYNVSTRKIFIPQELVWVFFDTARLALAFIDVLKPQAICQILLKNVPPVGGVKSFGSVITPEIVKQDGFITILIKGSKYQVKIGELSHISFAGDKADIKFESNCATLLKKEHLDLEIDGGKLGILVDARIKL